VFKANALIRGSVTKRLTTRDLPPCTKLKGFAAVHLPRFGQRRNDGIADNFAGYGVRAMAFDHGIWTARCQRRSGCRHQAVEKARGKFEAPNTANRGRGAFASSADQGAAAGLRSRQGGVRGGGRGRHHPRI